MNAGLLIKEHRERKNLSRTTLSGTLGIHLNTYAKIESGEREPDRKELETICDLLDLNPSLFFKNAASSYFRNGDNSPGAGNHNTITMDKTLLDRLIVLMDKLADKLG